MTHSATSSRELLGQHFWPVYLSSSTVLHAFWELAHSPLYTFWRVGSFAQIASDVVQCTLGDMAIAVAAALAGWWCSRKSTSSFVGRFAFAAIVIASGFVLTAAIEWASVHLLGRWGYDQNMPVLPLIHLGISPLLQWLIVPAVVLWLAFRWDRADGRSTRPANP